MTVISRKNFNAHKHLIERVVVTGPMLNYNAALDYCDRNGYDVVDSGPRVIRAGKVDVNRFKIVGERKAE